MLALHRTLGWMFYDADAFSQDLSSWNIKSDVLLTEMFEGASKMLTRGWSSTPSVEDFSAGDSSSGNNIVGYVNGVAYSGDFHVMDNGMKMTGASHGAGTDQIIYSTVEESMKVPLLEVEVLDLEILERVIQELIMVGNTGGNTGTGNIDYGSGNTGTGNTGTGNIDYGSGNWSLQIGDTGSGNPGGSEIGNTGSGILVLELEMLVTVQVLVIVQEVLVGLQEMDITGGKWIMKQKKLQILMT